MSEEAIREEVRMQYSETGDLECPSKYEPGSMDNGRWTNEALKILREENARL